MTRDKFEELTKMLLSDNFWNSKKKLTKKERRLRRKSMLIPKPKFKVGDLVTFQNDRRYRNITTKLVWVDYWNGKEEPSEEIKEILTNSLLIPKAKFKKGDKIRLKGSNLYPEFIVADYSYYPEQKTWKYEGISSSDKSVEDALELVERK